MIFSATHDLAGRLASLLPPTLPPLLRGGICAVLDLRCANTHHHACKPRGGMIYDATHDFEGCPRPLCSAALILSHGNPGEA